KKDRPRAYWLVAEASSNDIDVDIEIVKNDRSIDETERQALIRARRGQGRFRTEVKAQWANACAVTGCKQNEVLRASHIKPWRESTNEERLDPENGLFLSANLDAMSDKGLISFMDSGEMIVSPQVARDEYRRLGIP